MAYKEGESIAEFKARIDAAKAKLPKNFTDRHLKKYGAVDMTDHHKNEGVIIGKK